MRTWHAVTIAGQYPEAYFRWEPQARRYASQKREAGLDAQVAAVPFSELRDMFLLAEAEKALDGE